MIIAACHGCARVRNYLVRRYLSFFVFGWFGRRRYGVLGSFHCAAKYLCGHGFMSQEFGCDDGIDERRARV
jgi:hypothetical protein